MEEKSKNTTTTERFEMTRQRGPKFLMYLCELDVCRPFNTELSQNNMSLQTTCEAMLQQQKKNHFKT